MVNSTKRWTRWFCNCYRWTAFCRGFVNTTAKHLGFEIKWSGKGLNEVGSYNNKAIIKIDPRYFRPTEVDSLIGDPSKAKKELGWEVSISFDDMVKEMAIKDLEKAKLEKNINLIKINNNVKN